MPTTAAPGSRLRVERGPDWLMVRVLDYNPSGVDELPLAERIWDLLQQHFTYRLVLELDEVRVLDSSLIGQLIDLNRRIQKHDGVLRLCGLSAYNRQVLHACRLDDRFRPYENRQEAVMGRPHTRLPR